MTTRSFPLQLHNGHLFTGISGQTFLVDTGAPTRFGTDSSVTLHGRTFDLPSTYLRLTASGLSNLVHNPVSGIVGADIVNQFDVLIECPASSIFFSSEPLEYNGDGIATGEFMGIPVIQATIARYPKALTYPQSCDNRNGQSRDDLAYTLSLGNTMS